MQDAGYRFDLHIQLFCREVKPFRIFGVVGRAHDCKAKLRKQFLVKVFARKKVFFMTLPLQ